MIDVAPSYLKMILDILQKHIPGYEVRAFGSRITGTAKKYSDLDLVVVGKTKIAKKIFYSLKDEFEESDLPFRVEIMDWHAISNDFREIIETQYEVIQTAEAEK